VTIALEILATKKKEKPIDIGRRDAGAGRKCRMPKWC